MYMYYASLEMSCLLYIQCTYRMMYSYIYITPGLPMSQFVIFFMVTKLTSLTYWQVFPFNCTGLRRPHWQFSAKPNKNMIYQILTITKIVNVVIIFVIFWYICTKNVPENQMFLNGLNMFFLHKKKLLKMGFSNYKANLFQYLSDRLISLEKCI